QSLFQSRQRSDFLKEANEHNEDDYFWRVEKVSYRVFSENYSPLKEFVATLRRDNIFEEKWMAIL
ncbi:hypothetical protein Golob_001010, partial [Gossypium lobatum]|nr:hypothetical protein [Gossypium lobatum]